jgi:hypothetical protein
VGADVAADDKLQRVEARGDDIGGEGEGGELGLEILETRSGGGEVGKLKQRRFFEVLGKRYAEEGKEALAA